MLYTCVERSSYVRPRTLNSECSKTTCLDIETLNSLIMGFNIKSARADTSLDLDMPDMVRRGQLQSSVGPRRTSHRVEAADKIP